MDGFQRRGCGGSRQSCLDKAPTISELSEDFPELSSTCLFHVIRENLDYRKCCGRWVPKQILTEAHKARTVESAPGADPGLNCSGSTVP